MGKIDVAILKKRMAKAIEILNEATEAYDKGQPIMTDAEWDAMYFALENAEKAYGVTLPNSPTVKIHFDAKVSELSKKTHGHEMLSLAKTKLVSELEKFLGDKEGIISWKLDGLTIVLTYNNGKLVSGVTRGNGILGEVVTENVKQFKNIPLTIPYQGKLVVRGEAVIKYSDFERMNKELDENEDTYKNPRNLCSGSVRQLDSKVTAKRNVNCIIFSLIESTDTISNSKLDTFPLIDVILFSKDIIFPSIEEILFDTVF